MARDASQDEALEHRKAADHFLGKTMSVLIGGEPVRCVVVRASKERIMLVPLGDCLPQSYDLDGVALRIETGGAKVTFVVDGQTEVSALVGTLRKSVIESESEPQPQPGTKEREFYRIAPDCRIEVSLDTSAWSDAVGENISEGGMLAKTVLATRAQIGQAIYIRLHLPDSDPVTLEGTVLRKENCGPKDGMLNSKCVVRFKDIVPEDNQKLVQYIYLRQVRDLQEKRRVELED